MGSGLLGSILKLHLQPDDQGPPCCSYSCHRCHRVFPGAVLTWGCYATKTGSPAEEALASTLSEATVPFPPSATCSSCCCYSGYHQRCQNGHYEPAYYETVHWEHTFPLPFKTQEETWQKLNFIEPCNLLIFRGTLLRCPFDGLLSSPPHSVSFWLNYCISIYCISSYLYFGRFCGFIEMCDLLVH